MKTITINGRKCDVAVHSFSFEYLVAMCFGDLVHPFDFAVTYRGAAFDGGYVGGTLNLGDKIIPAEGMAITVVRKV